jgi:hypothetical protein
MSSRVSLPLVFAALALMIGCGAEPLPEFGQVTGVVKAKGKPLKGMIVTFMPEPAGGKESPINAEGTTDEQGKYELTYGYKGASGKGAPVGMHRVLVMDTRYSSIPQGAKLPPRYFPLSYSSPTTTPLKLEVKSGPQTIDLDLK